ncbi:MAG: hypothetical protein CME33_04315 [Gimesia sp.]|uniref:hypothetical protein n=1 Tax=Gimesia sp. TaxID=2024833 RepID=UPI000C48512F|nr:hypothetical protein [Gimesia sp.]MAX35777.1 hypothetical protein [Gimesia sp.]|tara:strand:+ start:347 stop:946 length:600 start_codon:yes stop_codon:yes gene_type:complete
MLLYHFTSLLHLPQIMREGLSRGEVPIGPYAYRFIPQAVNLTKDGTARGNSDWNKSNYLDKTRVRILVDLPNEHLMSFRQMRKKFQVKRSWVRKMAPNQEHRNWYFAFDGVPTDQIQKVEIAFKQPGRYEEVSEERLAQIQKTVEAERASLPIVETSEGPAFAEEPRLLDSWLLDGPCLTNLWPKSPLSSDPELIKQVC